MRCDAIGLFWEDLPPEKKAKKEKEKRQPPERLWERKDYLPYLEEALAAAFNYADDNYIIDMWSGAKPKEAFVFDTECYPNYALFAFKGVESGKVMFFETHNDGAYDRDKLLWFITNFLIVTFNGINYDQPIVTLACCGKSNLELSAATNMIIVEEMNHRDVLKKFKVKKLTLDHIDLIEVAPQRASLKLYSGRMSCKRMQDLPFKPGTVLSTEQALITRYYCVNDLDNTILLYKALSEQISLRITMSKEYNIDLRSKSDAQIAEAVIRSEIETMVGHYLEKPTIAPGTAYRYNIPHFLNFKTPLMQKVLETVRNTPFIVSEFGNVGMPPQLANLQISIGKNIYRMGIGGLHSCESSVSHVSGTEYNLVDYDVTSFYPRIILNQGLYPKHLGTPFLTVYESIVNRRIAAKERGDDVVQSTLKIVINGSYGKLGSMYSILYAPDLLIQVTITGQLSLLMLIEALELAGVEVASANTDGIVVKVPVGREEEVNAILKWWQDTTNFNLEDTRYKALYSRDVNSYIAVYEKPKKGKLAKLKGAFGEMGLTKNPQNEICVDAAVALITTGKPVYETIRESRDITKFVSIRNVSGGAVKMYPGSYSESATPEEQMAAVKAAGWVNEGHMWAPSSFENPLPLIDAYKEVTKPRQGDFLGKSIRWYYAEGEEGEIVSAKSGNKVPKTENARPIMQFPEQFPTDINYEWYIQETEKILSTIAYGA